MSFTSQKRSQKAEIVVIGNRWTALVMGYSLLANGHRPKVFVINDPNNAEAIELPVHVGNGECMENARLTFGEKAAGALWETSAESYRKLKALLTKLSLPHFEGKTLWFASDERQKHLLEETARKNPVATILKGPEWLRQGGKKFETVINEPALLLHTNTLCAALKNIFVQQEVSVAYVDKFVGIEKHHVMEYRLEFETDKKSQSAIASVVLLMSDRISPALFPWTVGKWMPVTLGSYTFKARTHKEFVLALFNGGADFVARSNQGLRVGSFRNLYQDKAVGAQTQGDPATLRGVTDFFSSVGWISAEAPMKTHVDVESLSCDGLPIIGPLADYPGVHLVAGFAGRTQNYFFEVAEQLARALLKEEPLAGRTELFSTKRFL